MRAVTCLLGCWILFSSVIVGQDDWTAVVALAAGTTIRVSPQLAQGRTRKITEDDLTLWVGGRSVTIRRSDIQRVERGRHQAGRKAAIGFLIGWMAGTVSWRHTKGMAPVLGLGAGALGAAIGASDGVFDYRYLTIYEAHPPEAHEGR